ncbi:MAG: sulfotransferase family protein [Paracoccaceae bacterium]
MAKLKFTPVVIIGAGRSGTNTLRDMLTSLSEFATWDCDEINPIWRHGNSSWPNDEIPATRATPPIRRFIRRAFERIWHQTGQPQFIVEKTCANSLRVPFVDAVLPEAKYVYIVRSGIDVVASARKRWRGDFEHPSLPYFAAKIRYTPLVDLPLYGATFLKARARLMLGMAKRLSVWGPRFDGMDALKDSPLDEICAHQWAACVNRSDAALKQIGPARVLEIRYEDLISDPKAALSEILKFLGTEASQTDMKNAVAPIRVISAGKEPGSQDALSETALDIMKAPLKAHGYGE